MHSSRFLYALYQALKVTSILLIAVLIGFEAIPFSTGSDAQSINQASLQRTRTEIFAKSVYALKYRSAAEKAIAIGDLQVSLPLFQQEQSILATNQAADVQAALQTARPDYLALVAAVQAILMHPTSPDPIEIEIVLSHERGYLLAINALVSILQLHADERATQLFCIKVFIEALLGTLIVLLVLVAQRMVKRVVEHEHYEEIVEHEAIEHHKAIEHHDVVAHEGAEHGSVEHKE